MWGLNPSSTIVPPVFRECSLSVPWVFLECSLSVPWVFLECCWSVPGVFPECSWSVPWVFLECSRSVPWVFLECSLECSLIGTHPERSWPFQMRHPRNAQGTPRERSGIPWIKSPLFCSFYFFHVLFFQFQFVNNFSTRIRHHFSSQYTFTLHFPFYPINPKFLPPPFKPFNFATQATY